MKWINLHIIIPSLIHRCNADTITVILPIPKMPLWYELTAFIRLNFAAWLACQTLIKRTAMLPTHLLLGSKTPWRPTGLMVFASIQCPRFVWASGLTQMWSTNDNDKIKWACCRSAQRAISSLKQNLQKHHVILAGAHLVLEWLCQCCWCVSNRWGFQWRCVVCCAISGRPQRDTQLSPLLHSV